jgi:putative acetyltransferase
MGEIGLSSTVRHELPSDIESIRAVNLAAFEQPVEADLVDALRRSCAEALSLVAVVDGQVVGHILFTPASLATPDQTIVGMGLAPMAVLPPFQRQGIGSQLVYSGLGILQDRACPFVIVLGHPEYYPRFGFEPASRHGLSCQWEGIPDEAFMVRILHAERMRETTGVVRYRDEFDAAM